MSERPLRVGFMMDQIAGHVTNYRNMRRVIDADPTIDATWCEIEFDKPDGRLERASRTLRVVPPYVTGMSRGAVELHRGLRSGQFDVLYTNSSVAAFFTRRFARTPTLLHLDSSPLQIDSMPTYPSPADPPPVAAVKRRMSTRLFTSVDAIQAWSSWARQSFVDDYHVEPRNVTVNPPGIDVGAWRRPTDLARPDGPVRVLFVGGDFERKGGELLLRWFGGQAPGTVELHIVSKSILAERPGLHTYRNMVPNSPELLRLFHTSDIFAMPSLGECFGIATVEAMSAELPVVGSDVGGTADIIDHGHNGFIVEAGSQHSLDKALDQLVANDGLRRSFARCSAEQAAERFEVSVTAGRVSDALRRLARPTR